MKRGMKVIALADYAKGLKHLTVDREYTVQTSEDSGNITVIGDDGNHRPHSASYFTIK
jgi:hypothetical protein|tara:strand:+ start:3368 stop:3541 length:174 start_codon:yes stop_codon:yes gene_type:complete